MQPETYTQVTPDSPLQKHNLIKQKNRLRVSRFHKPCQR